MGIPFEICHSMFSGDRAVFRTYRHALHKFSRSQRLDTVKQFKRTPFKNKKIIAHTLIVWYLLVKMSSKKTFQLSIESVFISFVRSFVRSFGLNHIVYFIKIAIELKWFINWQQGSNGNHFQWFVNKLAQMIIILSL